MSKLPVTGPVLKCVQCSQRYREDENMGRYLLLHCYCVYTSPAVQSAVVSITLVSSSLLLRISMSSLAAKFPSKAGGWLGRYQGVLKQGTAAVITQISPTLSITSM